MTSKENGVTEDKELLDRYRRASGTELSAPSDAVRAAILAEGRRVAEQLAKQESKPTFDASRPAANDSRWKITAFGTLGAALLAALLIAPRFWGTFPAANESAAKVGAPVSEPAAAPPASPQMAPSAALAPKAESVSPTASSDALQDAVVTSAKRRSAEPRSEMAAKASPLPRKDLPLNAPAPPPAPSRESSAAGSAAQAYVPLEEKTQLAAAARSANSGVYAGILAGNDSLSPPLQSAAESGDAILATRLLDRGATVDQRDAQGRTPLWLAVAHGRLEIVRLLLQRGADPNAADNSGKTPLRQALDQDLKDIAALLKNAGAR